MMAKGDRWILVILLVAAACAFGARGLTSLRSQALAAGLVLEISTDEGLIEALPVESMPSAAETRWELTGAAGGLCLTYVPERGFHVETANCPDRVCVRSGYITKAGQSIVCVPNRLIISITGGSGPFGDSHSSPAESVDAILR